MDLRQDLEQIGKNMPNEYIDSSSQRFEAFKLAFSEWTDWDWASYQAGLYTGLLEPGTKYDKGTYWSNTPIGHSCGFILLGMVHCGMLLYREEPDQQYKWNPDYFND